MGLPASEINPEANDAPTKLYDGEDTTTREFSILLQVAIKTYVRREATEAEVPTSAVWTALEVSPVVNQLMNHLPQLLAQASLAQRARLEEIACEEQHQQILLQYEENNRRWEAQQDGMRLDT